MAHIKSLGAQSQVFAFFFGGGFGVESELPADEFDDEEEDDEEPELFSLPLDDELLALDDFFAGLEYATAAELLFGLEAAGAAATGGAADAAAVPVAGGSAAGASGAAAG
jgi:hypothetical protein